MTDGDAAENQNATPTQADASEDSNGLQLQELQLEELNQRVSHLEGVLADLREQIEIRFGNLGRSSRNDYRLSLLLVIPTNSQESAGVDEISYCDNFSEAKRKQEEIFKRRDMHKRRVVILQPSQDSRNFSEFR